jgi:Rrf2 family protein
MTELVKKQFVVSSKGPSGGFKLAVTPESISLYRILAVLGGLSNLEDSCVMGLSQCTKEMPCALHDLWTDFREKTISKTQKLTLQEFSQTFTNKLQCVR